MDIYGLFILNYNPQLLILSTVFHENKYIFMQFQLAMKDGIMLFFFCKTFFWEIRKINLHISSLLIANH